MERYRDGDAGAFDALYGRHKGGVFRYLARQCGNRGVAEELFQDVWMNLIRARAGYTVQAKFTTYLYRLAHNRLIDHYRAQSGNVPASFDDEAGPSLDEVAGDLAETHRLTARRLRQALRVADDTTLPDIVAQINDTVRALTSTRVAHAKLTGDHAPDKHAVTVDAVDEISRRIARLAESDEAG